MSGSSKVASPATVSLVYSHKLQIQLLISGHGKPISSCPNTKCLFNTCYCSSVTKSCPTVCKPMDCSFPGLPILHHLLEPAQTHIHWVSDAIQPSHPLSSPSSSLPSIRVFFNESALHIRWPKYWSFSFSISPSNEYSGLISFRIGWFDLLAVQGTLRSLLQHHSSKASILQHSAFFRVQL